MAIALRGAKYSGSAAAGTSMTATYPTGIVAGDVILLFFACKGSTTITTPTGYTALGTIIGSGTNVASMLYFKVAAGTESGTFSIGYGTSAQSVANIIALSGADTTTPPSTQYSHRANASGNTPSAAALGSWTASNGISVFFGALNGNAATTEPPPSTYTQPAGSFGISAGTTTAIMATGLGYKSLTAATTVAALTAAAWGTSGINNGASVFIKEAAPVMSVAQSAFRLYEDGTEAGSTAIAAQDTNITRDVTTSSNLALRVRLQESGGAAGVATDDYQLRYAYNGGEYVNVGDLVGDDYYSVLNQTSTRSLITGSEIAVAQSFTGDGVPLNSVAFHLRKTGAPTGNAVAKVYAHSGTFGTSSVPTGAALATSSNLDVSTLTTTLAVVTIPISGFTPVTGTNYVVSFEYAGPDASNFVQIGVNTSAPTHAGNFSSLTGATWSSFSSRDTIFYINPRTPVTAYASANLTDGGATTNRLGAGTGSFVAGEVSETGLVTDHQLTASNYTEHLYSLTLASSALNNADTLDFRALRNGAVLNTYTVTPRITASKTTTTKAHTLTADFTSGTVPTGMTGFGSYSITGGQLILPSTASSTAYAGIEDTAATHDLTSSYFFSQIVNAGNQTITNWQIKGAEVKADATHVIIFAVDNNRLYVQTNIGGTFTDIRGDTAYNSAVHKYFALHESGGTTYASWATTPTGAPVAAAVGSGGNGWTVYTSLTNPFTMSTVQLEVSAGQYTANVATTQGIIDNISILPTTDSTKFFLFF